jgi:hypothetical protein
MAVVSVASAFLAEIVAALAAEALEHEGLRDLARLNLTPEALRDVRASLDDFDRRVQKLEAAKVVVEALLADGYPELGPRDVSDAALEDLQKQRASIDAALAHFTAGQAVSLNLSAGPPEPK